MPLVPKKTCQVIIDSGNHYIGALKGNQSGLLEQVQENFIREGQRYLQRAWSDWKRTLSICHAWWYPRMARVEDANSVDSERQTIKAQVIQVSTETRYYISSLNSSVQELAQQFRLLGRDKVHYVRDVTQGGQSRIRTTPLVQMFALARNFALNLYRESGFENMAQANRLCSLVWRNSRQYLKWLNDAPIEFHSHNSSQWEGFVTGIAHNSERSNYFLSRVAWWW